MGAHLFFYDLKLAKIFVINLPSFFGFSFP